MNVYLYIYYIMYIYEYFIISFLWNNLKTSITVPLIGHTYFLGEENISNFSQIYNKATLQNRNH